MITHRSQSGFSLVELIVYIALSSLLLVTLGGFVITTNRYKQRQQTSTQIQSDGAHAIHTITQAVRNADAITSPTVSQTQSSLTLETANVATNPTVFSITDGVLFVQEGASTAIPLTSDSTAISSFSITNTSAVDTPGTIRIILTLDQSTSSTLPPFSQTLYASATLRNTTI